MILKKEQNTGTAIYSTTSSIMNNIIIVIIPAAAIAAIARAEKSRKSCIRVPQIIKPAGSR